MRLAKLCWELALTTAAHPLVPSPGTPEQPPSNSVDSQVAKLKGTLQHYRNWAGQIQARYQLFNPDAARPARRIYVGGCVRIPQMYVPFSLSLNNLCLLTTVSNCHVLVCMNALSQQKSPGYVRHA